MENYSGLPLSVDEENGGISFYDGLQCDGYSEKKLSGMEGLFRDTKGCGGDAPVYRAYRNIRFPEDEDIFERFGFRYDITVILPGSVNGEYHKTSGHYHGCAGGSMVPYPEVYEVIKGEIVFILQKNPSFARADGGRIEDLQAVHVREGEAVIVPPFCGHGSVNPAGMVSAFSNIAVKDCPLFYDPVRERHGLAAYIMEGGTFRAVPNERYGSLPPVKVTKPVEDPGLGIEFGVPCYRNFTAHPEKYDFLLHPEPYMDRISRMTV